MAAVACFCWAATDAGVVPLAVRAVSTSAPSDASLVSRSTRCGGRVPLRRTTA